MNVKQYFEHVRSNTLYENFEHAVIGLVTLSLVVIVIGGVAHLLIGLAEAFVLDLEGVSEQVIFQRIFGTIFTILIALEFKRSLLIVKTAAENMLRIRSIILIAMLATVRKFIVLDISTIDVPGLLALAGSILALGIVYWLVSQSRDAD